MTVRIGILGVGEIAEAIVDGLSSTARSPLIEVSPRGASTASMLATKYPNVTVCPNNQTVVDRSDIILLTVRPADVETVLRDLRFTNGKTLVSAVAGWSREALLDYLPDSPDIVRVIPLPAVRDSKSVTVIFPRHPTIETLFAALGETLLADDESHFSALSAVTATISSHLTYLASIADWLVTQGIAEATADKFVRSIYLGIGGSLNDVHQPLTDLVRSHETPQGINEELRHRWFDPPNQARLKQALDFIRERVSSPPAGES